MIRVGKAFRSFRFASKGIGALIRRENNARIHMVATAAATVAGFVLSISALEWAVVAALAGFVWAAEAINTALERLVDLVSPGPDPRAGEAKDLAAAAVLFASIAAFIGGLAIFVPKILSRIAAN